MSAGESVFSFDGKATGGAGDAAKENQSGAGSVSDATRREASAEVNATIAARPKRAYTRRNPSTIGSNNDDVQTKVNAAIVAQLEAAYDPRAVGALLTLPANVALTVTGKDRWKVSEAEQNTLGASGAAALRTMMITNPKSLAFMLLGAGLFAVYVPRAMAELREWQEKKAKEKEGAEKKPA